MGGCFGYYLLNHLITANGPGYEKWRIIGHPYSAVPQCLFNTPN